jgi:hypothetical protein
VFIPGKDGRSENPYPGRDGTNQRHRVGTRAAEVQIVDPEPVNLGDVVRILVQHTLLRVPVELVQPIIGKRRHPVAVQAVRPSRTGHRVRPTCLAQAPLQIVDGLVGDGNREPLFGHVPRTRS